jgi:type VI secretion system protein ImpG
MTDELLPYYNQELAYLMKLGAEFAELHPAVAGHLRMSADTVEDPHVSRLLQGVAFLNARIRRKLDDEFPELTDALLGELYPHYLAPIPSMAIVGFDADKDLDEPSTIPRGTLVETEPVGGEFCTFRTTQDVEMWPLEIESAALSGRAVIGPVAPFGCVATLRLSLQCLAPEKKISELAPDRLRFFVRGTKSEALRLYELILNNTVKVAVADTGADRAPLVLDTTDVHPVGFGPDEGMLPYGPRSALGYRLLTEYFAFPEKFLFFELEGLKSKLTSCARRGFDLYFYFSRSPGDLERAVSQTSLVLGCSPVVNLFEHRPDPISMTETAVDYQIVPDSRRPGALEVYSVDAVTATSASGEAQRFAPFFGLTHASVNKSESRYWHAARRAARDGGTDTFLSLVDLEDEPVSTADAVISLRTTCLNRDLPAKLPFGGGHPYLRFTEPVAGVRSLACLTAPTPTLRVPSRREGAWRLISHLTLNHLSLTDQTGGAEALREILKLYDFRDAPETRTTIDSVLSVRTARGAARAPDSAARALCTGLDVTIEFDERASGAGVFLFAAVLERFLGLYTSINSFTRLTAVIRGRAGVLRTWTPRAGHQSLL